MEKSIIIFDGVCKLCHYAVIFIIRRDPQQHFLFSPIQSDTAAQLCQQYNIDCTPLNTFVLIKNGRCYTRSRAALEVCTQINGAWFLLSALRLLPAFITDIPYRFIAHVRYRIWGKYPHCLMPTSDIEERFLN